MTDYGHDLLFGTFLTPNVAQADRVVALAQLTEQVGLDLVAIQDHPYQPRFLDVWILLSVIAARTSTVRVAPNVVNLPLRPPVVLARTVTSLDHLSGGRVELGLGAGGFAQAAEAIGGPRLTAADRVAALEEALHIIREIWTPEGGGIRLDGKYYSVVGAKRGPAPAHDVEIWLGAVKPRMLELTGRLGDGWSISSGYTGPDKLPAMNAAIDEAADAAGRSPSDVRRLYNVGGRFDANGNGFLQGPERLWVEQLTELTLVHGMSAFILASDSPDDIRRFAEVAPAVREAVAAARSSDPSPPVGNTAPGGVRTEDRDPRTTAPGGVPLGDGGARTTALGVVPTADSGVRLSDARPWDESARPSGPAPDPRATYTAEQRAGSQRLVEVHDHLRSELAQIRELVERVTDGTFEPGAARSHLNTLTMRQNNWTLGMYCESYCRLVTTHHTLEDQALFPQLRRSDPRLKPVIDRLEEEHGIIHGIIERVDQALVALATDPTDIAGLRSTVDLLTDALLSHLSYEEHQLLEPLARLESAT